MRMQGVTISFIIQLMLLDSVVKIKGSGGEITKQLRLYCNQSPKRTWRKRPRSARSPGREHNSAFNADVITINKIPAFRKASKPDAPSQRYGSITNLRYIRIRERQIRDRCKIGRSVVHRKAVQTKMVNDEGISLA